MLFAVDPLPGQKKNINEGTQMLECLRRTNLVTHLQLSDLLVNVRASIKLIQFQNFQQCYNLPQQSNKLNRAAKVC